METTDRVDVGLAESRVGVHRHVPGQWHLSVAGELAGLLEEAGTFLGVVLGLVICGVKMLVERFAREPLSL